MLLTLSEAFLENEEAVNYVRGMMLGDPNPQPPDAFARQLEASRRYDSRDRLGSLTMPIHVIGCEYDILVPIWKQHELAELIPNAKLTEIERCAHGANVERAPEFNAHVLDFIAEHAAAPV
jgi:pimeloyl-ACP methyl ester carboxylesterase